MGKEIRTLKVIKSKSGSGSDSFRFSIPTSWAREMKLDISQNVEVSFDGEKIIIKKINRDK